MIPEGDLLVAPSMLSADFGTLASCVAKIEPVTPWLHVDVMDGHFVPNLTIGPPVVASLRRHTDCYLDCHLMMTNPERYLEAFKDAGADLCSVHLEVGNTDAHIEHMRALGLDVGLVVNPETPVEPALLFLDRIDLLLVMSVHPGFGGQRFIGDVLSKVEAARRAIDGGGYRVALEIDGGIDTETVVLAASAGARVFVAGSAVFSNDDPAAAVLAIEAAARSALEGNES